MLGSPTDAEDVLQETWQVVGEVRPGLVWASTRPRRCKGPVNDVGSSGAASAGAAVPAPAAAATAPRQQELWAWWRWRSSVWVSSASVALVVAAVSR